MVAKVLPGFNTQEKREGKRTLLRGPKCSYMNSGVHTNKPRCTQCKHTRCLASGTRGQLTPRTLLFLLHDPNASEMPSNGVINPCPPGDKEHFLGSNATAFTSRPHCEALAMTWASPGHLGPARRMARPGRLKGLEPWGDSRGWGQKAVLGHTSEMFRLASQLELKAAPCLVCLSILTREEQPSQGPVEDWRAARPRDGGSV